MGWDKSERLVLSGCPERIHTTLAEIMQLALFFSEDMFTFCTFLSFCQLQRLRVLQFVSVKFVTTAPARRHCS